MNTNSPLISVFIPYFNDKDFLTQAIQGVLNQTYKNFELILFNHASTDGSDKIAKSFNDDRIIYTETSKNLGAGSGYWIKEFLKIAKGKYVKLLCADDIIKPNCLEILCDYLEKNPNKDVVFGDMEYINQKNKSLKTKWSIENSKFDFDNDEKKLLKMFFYGIGTLPYPAALIKKAAIDNINLNTTLISMFDMHLWTSLILNNAKFACLKDVVINYRIHDAQVSSKKNNSFVRLVGKFETTEFLRLFYNIKNIDILKDLCKYSPFLSYINEENKKYFPFIMAHYCLLRRFDIGSYLYIAELLSDEQMADELNCKFNFGIKEFRALYAKMTSKNVNPLQSKNIFEMMQILIKYPRLFFKTLIINKHFYRLTSKYTV